MKAGSFYIQFAVAIFVANLIISLIDGAGLGLRNIMKAVLAGVIAAAILFWYDRRKSRRAS